MKATTVFGLGVICFVLLTILCLVLVPGYVEDDLLDRSLKDLQVTGQDWASVEMDGQTAILSGTAPDGEAAQKAIDVVSEVWGVTEVADETTKP